jgi:hypothetical protein
MENPTLRFNELLKELAQQLQELANQTAASWDRAVVTRVFSKDGRSSLSKLRIHTVDGVNAGVSPPADWLDIWDELWVLRAESIANSWYGIVIGVESDGKCKVTFDYNEDCISDPTFFDT